MEKSSAEWISSVYYQTLDAAMSTSYNYMHTALNWAISILTAVVLLIVLREAFPDPISWIALSVSILLISHFAVRTAKGYINTLRWSTIQREIIRSILRGGGNAEEVDELNIVQEQAMLNYHVQWASPLPFPTVVNKLLFELGFIYLYALVIAVMIYVAIFVTISPGLIAVTFVCLALTLLEFFRLKRSPYLRNVKIDQTTKELR